MISFDGVNVYQIRFKLGWTGVFNPQTQGWEGWTPQIGNPNYDESGDSLVITQEIDLAFFTALGQDISTIRFCSIELSGGVGVSLTNNGLMLDERNINGWLNLIAPD